MSFFVGTEAEQATSDREAIMDAAYQRAYGERMKELEPSEPLKR